MVAKLLPEQTTYAVRTGDSEAMLGKEEGAGGPGRGPMVAGKVHVPAVGAPRRVKPSFHKARRRRPCPPGEHRHDEFPCHPRERRHRRRGMARAERSRPPFPTIEEIDRATRDALRQAIDARTDSERERWQRRVSELMELRRRAREWWRSQEGKEFARRMIGERLAARGARGTEYYLRRVRELEQQVEQLLARDDVFAEALAEPYEKLQRSLQRARAMLGLHLVRRWQDVLTRLTGVEPQITGIKVGAIKGAAGVYYPHDGVIGISEPWLAVVGRAASDPDIWDRPEGRDALEGLKTLVHEFLHSVNPIDARDLHYRATFKEAAEEGLAEALARRMVRDRSVLSALLGREVGREIDEFPAHPWYRSWVLQVEYLAALAARRTGRRPREILEEWKFRVPYAQRPDVMLRAAGLERWPTAREAEEGLSRLRKATRMLSLAREALRTLQWFSLPRLDAAYATSGGWPGGGSSPPGTRTGAPPRGVGYQKLPHSVDRLAAARVYVESPEDVPEGYTPKRGPRGGIYYETRGRKGRKEYRALRDLLGRLREEGEADDWLTGLRYRVYRGETGIEVWLPAEEGEWRRKLAALEESLRSLPSVALRDMQQVVKRLVISPVPNPKDEHYSQEMGRQITSAACYATTDESVYIFPAASDDPQYLAQTLAHEVGHGIHKALRIDLLAARGQIADELWCRGFLMTHENAERIFGAPGSGWYVDEQIKRLWERAARARLLLRRMVDDRSLAVPWEEVTAVFGIKRRRGQPKDAVTFDQLTDEQMAEMVKRRDALHISDYGETNHGEYFADAYAAWVLAKAGREIVHRYRPLRRGHAMWHILERKVRPMVEWLGRWRAGQIEPAWEKGRRRPQGQQVAVAEGT